MPKYQMAHIDNNAWTAEGGKIYNNYWNYSTWQDLTDALASNSWTFPFLGAGSDIFSDGECIGHTDTLRALAADREYRGMSFAAAMRDITLKEFCEHSKVLAQTLECL